MSTPIEIDQKLASLVDEISLWDQRLAWFEAKRDWYKTRLSLAEARAQLSYKGVAASSLSKPYAISQTEKERTDLDIANAELLMCERKMHSLDKATYLLLGRNKNAMNSYTVGDRW
jgi:hypothetical protein